MVSPLPPKKDVALALIERTSVLIHLDPRHDAVRVPTWFKKQPQLVLQVGLNLAVQIPDLEFDDDGVSGTLSFSRQPHYCFVPWNAVFALVGENGQGMVWPSDIPKEVTAQAPSTGTPAGAGRQERPRRLRAIQAGTPVEDVQKEAVVSKKPSLPSYLRVIK